MSRPIAVCALWKACSDEVAYQRLLEVMRYNVKFGAFTICPCAHEPPCKEVPMADIVALDWRLASDMQESKKKHG